MQNEPQSPTKRQTDLSLSKQFSFSPSNQLEEAKRVENIIYSTYIQQRSMDLSRNISNNSSKGSYDFIQESKQSGQSAIWEQMKREFKISNTASINQLYTNQKLIGYVIHYLMGLPFTENSKKIIKNIVEYYDPSRKFIKLLIQSLVPALEHQQSSELNKINVILYTFNALFKQQSPQNPKFNSYIYLNGGEGIKVQNKIRYPFEKSGTICLWYNMSDETKECKLFEICGQKSGFQIVLKDKKLYFQNKKQKSKFFRKDSIYLCEAKTNIDVKLWIEFEVKKKVFSKGLFLNVMMNNFVLSNIEVDLIDPQPVEYSITMFKKFYGKVFSVLVFTKNLIKEVQSLNSKQGFIYQSDIKNFSIMFQYSLSQVLFLYTSIRTKTFTNQQQKEEKEDKDIQFDEEFIEDEQKQTKLFNEDIFPTKTIVFDALHGQHAVIGPEACVYRNISIHKKQISLYGGLPTYIGFFNILKQHAKYSEEGNELYTTALGELILLFKNIFQSKTTTIEQAENIDFFRIMSNFFIETQMVGYNEEITPKLKELYVSLNNRVTRQRFIKKFIWSIPAGEYLEIPMLQNYLNLVKGFYIEQIQSSLFIFNVKDIICFIIDNYDRNNCCFEHTRSSSIDHRKKIKKYPQVLQKYFDIIEIIIEIKKEDVDLIHILHEVISCFRINASPCFIDASVKFLLSLLNKGQNIANLLIEQFQTVNSAKMGLFSALANSYSWKTKANLISLILKLYGIKMFREGGEKDMLTLCIRFPTLTARFSSIKSQDIERSVDKSEDKFSYNSTGVKTVMKMQPLALEQMVQLNDEQIIKVIWDWGIEVIKSIPEEELQDDQNPGILLLSDLYKGSTYKIRKMITSHFIQNHGMIIFTADMMAWVIQCLLLCQTDEKSVINSDQLVYQNIQETKCNLLKLISIYRVNSEGLYEEKQNELDIIKLILISVTSKYPKDIGKLHHQVYLLISEEIIRGFHQCIKDTTFQNQDFFKCQVQNILSNIYKCLIEHAIRKDDEEYQFEEESEMEENQKEKKVILDILFETLELLLSLTSPGTRTLMDESSAHRNSIMFMLLFPPKIVDSQIPVCLFNLVFYTLCDDFDDLSTEHKKITLTLIKRYLMYMIQITQNSGSLKIEHKFEQIIETIFINALGFLETKFCSCAMETENERISLSNKEDIKHIIINIFFELLHFMRYIQDISSQHKSFYDMVKTSKKKKKNEIIIKNTYPVIWKKCDPERFSELKALSQLMDDMSNPNHLKTKQECKEKLEEHLKNQRLLSITRKVQKAIMKNIDKLKQCETEQSEEIKKNSVFSYQKKQSKKCQIYTDYEEKIAIFMFQNNGKQNRQIQHRRIEAESVKRNLKYFEAKIWKENRIYEGFWSNPNFYTFSQNNQNFISDNSLSTFYQRVRSNRQSKYLLRPFISIEPVKSQQNITTEMCFDDEEIYTVDQMNEEEEKPPEQMDRRKSDKFLQVGFQFLKKNFIEKIKKTANIARSKSEESEQEKKPEQFYFKNVMLIEPMKVHSGTLKLDNQNLCFQYRKSNHLQHISLLKNRQQPSDPISTSWPLANIETYQIKRYMLRPSSVEFFFKDKFSVFFSFYGEGEQHFLRFVDLMQKYRKIENYPEKIPLPLRCIDTSKGMDKYTVTQLWKNRQLSNFQYILSLNILSGRTNCDLNQYFIFPWIFSDYRSSKYKKDQCKYRDMEKTMGSLGSPERMQKFIDIKNNIEENHKDQFIQSHFFGFHYSNLPIVLQYLIRLRPYSQGAMQLQGGKFDIPDRLFTSIGDTFRNASSQMSDVRQLIPQFFYFPEFLMNCEEFDFGILQNNKKVDNVELPDGYTNSYDFIEAHRQELESEYVSENLNKWIDLIFGYKQYGKECELSFNKFHYLSYENNAHMIFREEKAENKQANESHMSYFGKVPSQLFTKPHPKRNPPATQIPSQYTEGYIRANPFINEEPIRAAIEEQLIRHPSGVFSFANESAIHFRYCEANRKYLLLRRDGKGIIFNNEKHELGKESRPLFFASAFHFEIFLDKVESIYIFDQSRKFDQLPICSLWGEHLFIGGLWGGKILKKDLITDKTEVHAKHSDTVCAITGNQQLALIVSGTVNGQIIIWQYLKEGNSGNNFNSYVHSSRKLTFKSKIVTHYGMINNIHINADLRVAVCSGQDGLVSIIDLERYQVIRMLKIGIPVRNTILLSYPYYMLFISCEQNKQFCYSINGQYLDESHFQNLHKSVQILNNGHQEKLIVKSKHEHHFSMIKLPEMREELKIQLKKEDNEVLEFQTTANQNQVEIIFSTHSHLVHCSHCLISNKSKNQRKGHM